MTEDEAMTKWCPFAMASGASFAVNRGPEGVANNRCMCLASECMAWRWKTDFEYDGHCGLAGRP
jgi:hypothetical protein